MPLKKVAIIGCGVSGLTSLKACLEQGLEATCFEMHDNIGGTWYYTKHIRDDQGPGIYDFLITNTSREMMRFSDFHFPHNTPVFPQHQDVHNYLCEYAEKFKLYDHIQFNTKVISLQKSKTYDTTGKWVIQTMKCDAKADDVITEEYDFVIISTGFQRSPFIPDIEGLCDFKGTYTHSQTFKNGEPYKGKNVLVIGNANSALDVSVGIAESTEQVYLSVGAGCWVCPRNAEGIPIDTLIHRRVWKFFPAFLNRIMRRVSEANFNHTEFGIRPARGPIHYTGTVNDDLGSRIASGKIKVVSGAVKFLPNGVKLDDGSEIKNLDCIIFATGFRPDHSLLDQSYVMKAYKRIFPIDLHKNSLAMIGMLGSNTPTGPVSEMQARMASMVFAGKYELPEQSMMEKDNEKWDQIKNDYYGPKKLLWPTLRLMDEIAEEIGVKPHFTKVFWRSPSVALQTLFGPAFSAHYRLQGDGATKDAVADCQKAWNLTTQGAKLRKLPPVQKDGFSLPPFHHLLMFTIIVFCMALFIVA